MPRRRLPPSLTHQAPRDDEGRLDGFQPTWLAYDQRTFDEILREWQDRTAQGDSRAFLQKELRLDGALTTRDLTRLLTGEAVPSRELALWLAAIVPADVATTRVLRNRGLRALQNAQARAIVGIAPSALVKARHEYMQSLLSGNHSASNGHEHGQFFRELMDLLRERAGCDNLEPEETARKLASALNIPSDALRGFSALSKERADATANQLASMLGLEEESFDDFANHAASALTHGPSATPTTAFSRLAMVTRFLRDQAGISQDEIARRLGSKQRHRVLALEKGYPSVEAHTLARAYHLDDETEELLSELIRESENELLRPSEGRPVTPFDQAVAFFGSDGLTTSDYLKAALKEPALFCRSPIKVADSITSVVERFAADGLTTHDFLKAALKRPQILNQAPSTIASNITGVVECFAADGLTTRDYLKAALKQPTLLCRSPRKIAGNMTSVVERFAADGLTTCDFLKAALKQPPLFTQSPGTIAGNITSVVERFATEGLTTHDYLKAALKQPSLFSRPAGTIAGNITSVVERFAADGLTTRAFLKAALKQPQILTQSPSTIASNITGVVERLAADGLTTSEYLKAVLKQPQLFCASPNTIVANVSTIFDLYDRGIVTVPRRHERGLGTPQKRQLPNGNTPAAKPSSHAAVLAFLLRNPWFFCLAQDNYALREVDYHLSGERPRPLSVPRCSVETQLMHELGHADRDHPVASDGFVAGRDKATDERAARFVLRALMREGVIRGGTLER